MKNYHKTIFNFIGIFIFLFSFNANSLILDEPIHSDLLIKEPEENQTIQEQLVGTWRSQENIYLYFNAGCNNYCSISSSQKGRFLKEDKVKKYLKIENDEISKVRYYICYELFIPKGPGKRTGLEDVKEIEFSRIEELVEEVNRKNPLYPSKVFDKIYLVEETGELNFTLFEVEWKYYIE